MTKRYWAIKQINEHLYFYSAWVVSQRNTECRHITNALTLVAVCTDRSYLDRRYMVVPVFAEKVLAALMAGIENVEEGFIEGLYLTGSIQLRDYQPGKSDIDFVFLCKELPAENVRLQLLALHQTIEQHFKHANLSGTYLTAEGLDVRCAGDIRTLSYHEGSLREGRFDMAPVTLYELKTTTITIAGRPLNELLIAIDKKEVNRFLSSNINSYWKTWVDRHAAFSRRGVMLMLFPRLTEWVILGLARQLYTLRSGNIASKTAAGYYCLEYLPAKYHWILQQAIAIRISSRKHLLEPKPSYYVRPSLKRAAQTVDCAYFLIDQFNTEYGAKSEISL